MRIGSFIGVSGDGLPFADRSLTTKSPFFGVLVLGCIVGTSGVILLRSSRKTAAALAVLLVLVPLTALATTVPFVFTNGTVADATHVNANFTALMPIVGANTFSGQTINTAGPVFEFPASPDFTAPGNLTCMVTVNATGTADGSTGNAALDVQ
ncbi:MAG TPA: hypothetical protein VK841_22650 [Polyangiaceae bacterium]|nr:hypothetical protein [Polyangiaceae bacterium]